VNRQLDQFIAQISSIMVSKTNSEPVLVL